MRALSSLGIGLAIVSILLFLALVAELYYIFWWKKRFNNNNNTNNIISNNPNFTPKSFFLSKGKGLLSLLPLRNPINTQQSRSRSPSPSPLNGNGNGHGHATQLTPDDALHLSAKDALLKASLNSEEAIDAELMRLHSLSGPPRFLFTIKEETREDLESDDGRSRGGRSRKGSRGRSLGDLLHCAETPILTPLSSPPLLGISAQSLVNLDSFKKLGFNPLFESSLSPPPKFKFLKDAEEKLQRRIVLLEDSRPEEMETQSAGRSGSPNLRLLPFLLSKQRNN
ncbi:transmembrane protein [Rhynchospora pubera]|uniref:Transmembrane protein n=1 Tax=Rhynchospora pubera TaxID=906938 RepID=A0AAV8E184_9POAL|nr:transmembrane protein [Rhynchospora pubera]